MNKLINTLTEVLWDSELTSSRVLLSMGELFWGIMLLWEGETFNRLPYERMSGIMEENSWAFVFLLSSIIQLYIVMIDKYHSRFSRYFACWTAVLWSYVSVSILLSIYPPPAAIGGELALAISAIWIWIRPYILVEGYKRARQQ